MSVLSTAETAEVDAVPVAIPRSVTRSAAAGGHSAAAGAAGRHSGGSHSPARGGQAPDGRELHIRQVHVRELHVREVRTGDRQAAGARVRVARRRELRSVTVHALETSRIGTRGAGTRGDGVPGSEVRGGRPGDDMRRGQRSAAGPGMPATGHAGQLRLTRRGRAVLAAVVILVVTAAVTATLFWLSAGGGAQAATPGAGPGTAHQGLSQVVVQPGQTLWSIASRAEPTADPRSVVQQIIEVNALGSPMIQAGQLLWVPKG
jgi:LysM domain